MASLQPFVEEYGDRVKIVAGDVTDPAIIKEAIDKALEFGSLDSVVANAGILDPVEHIDKADVSKWRNLFDINFFSVVELTKQALPHLKKSGGKIVAVSSGALKNSYDAWAAYGSSKAALNHFIQSVVAENKDIGAISFAPGVVDTSMQVNIREKYSSDMSAEAHNKFVQLKANNQLVPPEAPATIMVNLALKGWKEELNGTYVRIGEEALSAYE